MFDFIAFPIGHFLKFIYETIAFENYGLAIVLLTIIIKTLLLPLYVKQYRSTALMSEIQPEIAKMQKKYKNDAEKLNEEMIKLYKENNVNPAGGCLPLIIQMPILFSLYYVISQPLKYMFGKSAVIIQQLYEKVPLGAERIGNMHDLSIINYFSKHLNQLSQVNGVISKNELLNLNFFGINLGTAPSLNFNNMGWQNIYVLIIPILAVLSTYISIKYSSQQSTQTSDSAMQNSMQNSMLLISPIMTGFVSFTVPTGMGLYWIISNIYQVLQQWFMNKYIIKNKVVLEEDCKNQRKRGKFAEKTM